MNTNKNKTFFVKTVEGTEIGAFENFKGALAHALWLAERQAAGTVEVSTFVNGGNPERDPTDQWEAGAGPANNDCADWPHVYRREPRQPLPPRHAYECNYYVNGGDCNCGVGDQD